MSQELRHTPTPWRLSETTDTGFFSGDQYVGSTCGTTNSPVDAAFIVRACNSHEDLIEALKHALNRLEDLEEARRKNIPTHSHPSVDACIALIRQTLVEAEGENP